MNNLVISGNFEDRLPLRNIILENMLCLERKKLKDIFSDRQLALGLANSPRDWAAKCTKSGQIAEG